MFFAKAHPRICIASALLAATLAAPALGCGVLGGPARLVGVSDRLELQLADGRLARLAGLDAPNAPAARARLAALWIEKPLKIALLAPKPDRWGRWLADFADDDGALLSDDLIAQGLARVTPEFETRACAATRLQTEAQARRASRGLWDEPSSILDAGDAESLAANDARFVLVEGVVRRVGGTRARYYLDFGRRGGFTVVVSRKWEAALRSRGVELAALAGHSVRARGYLDNRFGARIELADPLMIEQTEGGGGSEPGK